MVSILVLCEGLAHDGAVATVAWKQAIGLSEFQPVHVVSDGFTDVRLDEAAKSKGSLTLEQVRRPRFRSLHRFGHLPRELVWIYIVLISTHRFLKAVAARSQGRTDSAVAVICHSHPVAAFVSRWFGDRVRIVMVSHGDIFHRPAGTYDPGITWLYRRTTGTAHLDASLNVALSPAMRARILAHGADSTRITLIPNGIDPLDIGLDKKPLTPLSHWQGNPLKILYVGRLEMVKGVDLLIKAAARLRDSHVDFVVDLIGGSSRASSLMLQESIHENNLTELVRVVGSTSRNALATHYLGAHVVVVPSRDDPLPTVALEAMACGRPVLGTDTGGLPFLIEHGRTGLLVPVNDEQGLAEALIHLNQRRELLAVMGEAGLSRVADFSWTSNIKSLQQCIENLVNESEAQHAH
jgi:glycosyltransferase involved in cell wall biosynthesis